MAVQVEEAEFVLDVLTLFIPVNKLQASQASKTAHIYLRKREWLELEEW